MCSMQQDSNVMLTCQLAASKVTVKWVILPLQLQGSKQHDRTTHRLAVQCKPSVGCLQLVNRKLDQFYHIGNQIVDVQEHLLAE